MTTILALTDFSDSSINAINWAAHIAGRTNAKVVLLHVCSMVCFPFTDRELLADELDQVPLSALSGQLNQIRESVRSKETVVESKIYQGNLCNCVNAAIASEHASLVVVGHTGGDGAYKGMGSNALMLLRHVQVPLLSIPAAHSWKAPASVALALFEDEDIVHKARPLFDMAKAFGATVHLFTCSPEDTPAVEVMQHSRAVHRDANQLTSAYPAVTMQYDHAGGKSFAAALPPFLESRKVDVLGLFGHHLDWFHFITGRSQSQEQLAAARLPLLVIPVNEIDRYE